MLCITVDGSLYVWGHSMSGRLGLGNKEVVTQPTLHPLQGVTEIACGLYHSCAITSSGSLFTWGENAHYGCGKKGDGFLSPELILEEGAKKVTCGGYHTFVTLVDGSVVGWGGSTGAEVGYSRSPSTPKPIKVLDGGRGVTCIAAGYNFSLMMDSAGRLITFGGNSSKIGSKDPFTKPGEVPYTWLLPRKFTVDAVWSMVAWIFLGKIDNNSDFNDFPIEILYHMVTVLYK